MIVYFSGTGNSRYAARLLAERLEDEIIDAGNYFAGEKTAALSSEKPWVFVCPTYAWRMPRAFTAFIERSSFTGAKEAYFVMTCGSDIGGAGKYIVKLCAEKDFRCMGVLPVVMPENYIAMFGVPDAAEAREIVADAKPRIESAAAYIAEGRRFNSVKVSVMGMLNSNFNGMFYSVCVKDKNFAAGDKCVGCGLCAKDCPMGNIRMENGRPVWNGNCTHCMRCICSCPQEAIEYGKTSVGKPRYKCPEV